MFVGPGQEVKGEPVCVGTSVYSRTTLPDLPLREMSSALFVEGVEREEREEREERVERVERVPREGSEGESSAADKQKSSAQQEVQNDRCHGNHASLPPTPPLCPAHQEVVQLNRSRSRIMIRAIRGREDFPDWFWPGG